MLTSLQRLHLGQGGDMSENVAHRLAEHLTGLAELHLFTGKSFLSCGKSSPVQHPSQMSGQCRKQSQVRLCQ
jgi:hypothetical protein